MLVVVLAFGLCLPLARATVDDALTFALEAMDKYIKLGYTLREDTWGGDLPVGEAKAITHQLFKGNDYWFTMGTSTQGGEDFDPRLRQRRQPRRGKQFLAERTFRQRDGRGGSGCKNTGTYFLIVKIEKSPDERTDWGLVYSYK